jgi:hypothetical protein
MTVTTKAARKVAAPAKPFAFKGRNAVVRNTALEGVATFAYAEGQSRADVVTRLKLALGNKPSADEVAAVARQYVIGRTAQKLSSDASMNGKSVAEMIQRATLLVTSYASPLKDGVKAKKLRAGQLGRRSPVEHKAIRASEEAWSQLKADVVPALSNAQSQSERNAKKRSTNANPVRGAGKAGTGLTHSELVKGDGKPHDRKSATGYVDGMAATLLAFSNKHAAVMPTAYGTAIVAFKKAIEAAAKAD